MRVLAHIHPFSAADLIDGTLDAVRRQTRPPDGILIGATTLRPTGRTFPEQVNPEALARLLELYAGPNDEFRAAAAHPWSPDSCVLARNLGRSIIGKHGGTLLGPMRILAHMHTFNDAAVIEQLLEGLRRQTRPLDAILIVDNASIDGTLDRTFPENVTIIRNPENLGSAGAARIGCAHALEHGFDWVWIFDADSVPEPDALEKLLAFFERLPPEQRDQVCFLAGRPLTETGEIKQAPIRLEGSLGQTLVPIASAEGFTRCDCMIWSGTLYRAAAIARIGLPSADYVLDPAEVEYGYRARQLGFTSYVVHNSATHHDVGRTAGATRRRLRLGPLRLWLFELSPIRCYYSVRNHLYMFIYVFKPRRMAVVWGGIKIALAITAGFAVRPFSHWPHLAACIRGFRDGLTGHMERRY